jgi:hypothetical protein
MELLLGHEKIITKSGISLNAGTLNWGFTVCVSVNYIKHFQSVPLGVLVTYNLSALFLNDSNNVFSLGRA